VKKENKSGTTKKQQKNTAGKMRKGQKLGVNLGNKSDE